MSDSPTIMEATVRFLEMPFDLPGLSIEEQMRRFETLIRQALPKGIEVTVKAIPRHSKKK